MARPAKESASQEVPKVSRKKHGGLPKRGPSAFFIWLSENRARLSEGVKPNKVLKRAGAEWKKVEDKPKWVEKARARREEMEALNGQSSK